MRRGGLVWDIHSGMCSPGRGSGRSFQSPIQPEASGRIGMVLFPGSFPTLSLGTGYVSCSGYPSRSGSLLTAKGERVRRARLCRQSQRHFHQSGRDLIGGPQGVVNESDRVFVAKRFGYPVGTLGCGDDGNSLGEPSMTKTSSVISALYRTVVPGSGLWSNTLPTAWGSLVIILIGLMSVKPSFSSCAVAAACVRP
jgi:hypothetical protein